jgi:menaquinone-9 beta-reductase
LTEPPIQHKAATREDADVVIVGAGPAGMSAAIQLARSQRPQLRVVVLEKSRHPRPKLCGGGVTPFGDDMLRRLGLDLEPPHVPVREIHFVFGATTLVLRGDPAMRVVRREDLDHWLVRQGIAAGALVRQQEAVRTLARDAGGAFVVTTDRGELRAPVVIAADGSASTVLRLLGWQAPQRTARLLETLTAPRPGEREAWTRGVAEFDFTPVLGGIQGYYWEFPSRADGVDRMSRGLYDSRAGGDPPAPPLRAAFEAELARRGAVAPPGSIHGFPLRWFDRRGPFAAPGLLLAGDAAGADPFFGEGIAFALAYGEAAARSVLAAFLAGDFAFAGYRRRILEHDVLRRLATRARVARVLYGLDRRHHCALERALGALARSQVGAGKKLEIRVTEPGRRRLIGEVPLTDVSAS